MFDTLECLFPMIDERGATLQLIKIVAVLASICLFSNYRMLLHKGLILIRRPLFKRIWNLAALICIGWRQVGESNFVIKAGEGSPLFGNAEMTKIENWRLRPAMGDAGLS